MAPKSARARAISTAGESPACLRRRKLPASLGPRPSRPHLSLTLTYVRNPSRPRTRLCRQRNEPGSPSGGIETSVTCTRYDRSPASSLMLPLNGLSRDLTGDQGGPTHSEFPEHPFAREVTATEALHLVPLDEEVTHMVVDMVVDRPVRLQPVPWPK